jgi:hypothetical protein
MNGSAADPLARFYSPADRRSPDLTGRKGIYGHVDALLNHLRVPAEIDPDGDWLLPTDAGEFTLFARDTDKRLVIRQKVLTLDTDLADYASDLQLLMLLNLDCEGACFASQRGPDETFMVVLTGQVPWEGLDTQTLGGLLEAAFTLARDLDDALTEVEAEHQGEEHVPAADPSANLNGSLPANWYDDPRGEARLRYWDGSAWTDHTAV